MLQRLNVKLLSTTTTCRISYPTFLVTLNHKPSSFNINGNNTRIIASCKMFFSQSHVKNGEKGISIDHSMANSDPMEISRLLQDSFISHPEESAYHIAKVQDALYYLHDTCVRHHSGLPWWMTIITLTWGLRTAFLPLNISLVRNSARLNSLRPKLDPMAQAMQDPNTPDSVKDETAKKALAIFHQHKCSPFKNLISPILMTPVFLTVFTAWERIIIFTPSCTTGGTLWFENLAASDISYMLPVLSAVTWIWTFRMGADRARSEAAVNLERFCSYSSLAMIPVTQVLPQGIFLYWLSSNVFSLLLMYMTRKQIIRNLLSIPPLVQK